MATPKNRYCETCYRPYREALTYQTALDAALRMQAILDSYELGEPHEKLIATHAALQFEVWMLRAMGERRCALCEIRRQQKGGQ